MRKTPLFLLLLLLTTAPLTADGGRIRMHQQAGPFLVTLFTTPDPLLTGPADFSVAVERSESQGLVEDAEVTLILTLPGDPTAPRIVVPATHQAATSRFLQAANLQLPRAGNWMVEVYVSLGNQAGQASTMVDVQPRSALHSQLFAQLLAIPCIILLYGLHLFRKSVKAARRS